MPKYFITLFKMRKLTYIFSILIILLLFVGCKKYEEGPTISLLTKKARITGIWEFSEITTEWDMARTLGFEKDGICYLGWSSGIINVNDVYYDFGEWEFDNNKEYLLIKSLADSINNTYKIIKLTNKELKLQISDKEYTTLLKLE